MKTKQINIFTCLLLLAIVAFSSACSMTKINAQSREQKPEIVRNDTASDSSKPGYEPPKRVSKDIIKKDEKPAKSQTR
jgi:hypothetical protein